MSATTDDDEILFERTDGCGWITLNRPKALNTLTHNMVRAFHQKLDEWEAASDVHAVLVKATGDRAFCAGGDIRAISRSHKSNGSLIRQFFFDEYRLNTAIKRLTTPYACLLNGITMGGGVGISVHGGYRVATERTTFAMPETGIGFFPDVGGSYFLPRCPGEIGMYLALTGARLKAADCVYAGVATHYVPSERLAQLESTLRDGLDPGDLEANLAQFDADPGPAPLADQHTAIGRCFAQNSVVEILTALENDGTAWADATRHALSERSPSSLRASFRLIRAGAALSFEDCMVMEYRLSQRMTRAHDFNEGVRAILVDKDNAPKWQPATLDGVEDAMIDAYFAPLEGGELRFEPDASEPG